MGNNVNVTNGRSGGTYIADTGTYVPSGRSNPWGLVQVIADATFDAATVVDIENLAASADSIPAGTLLGGNWTKIVLTTGAVIAYKTP